MKPERDHIHAQFGTRRNLLLDQKFLWLIEAAEAFCGAPFTLCRCSGLGKDTINLTGKVRQTLWDGRWLPESGFVEMGVLEPAHGRWFSLQMKLPLDTGHLAEIHYRLEQSYVAPGELEATVAFFKQVAISLDVEFGYAHHAQDELIQDTFDAVHYRALTGEDPPTEPIDPKQHPGRSKRVGQFLITCHWLNFFGSDMVNSMGYTRVMDAPCQTEMLDGNLVSIRLYDDPLAYGLPEHRKIQSVVREHLRLDDLIDTFKWEPAERSSTKEVTPPAADPPQQEEQEIVEDVPAPPPSPIVAPPFFAWVNLADASPTGLPGEKQFYTEQARRAAGRILEIGCGTGRLTIPIAKTGVSVVGIDSSAGIINHLKGALEQEAPSIQGRTTLIVGDILDTDFAQYGPFAAALIPYRGINRFTDRQSVRNLLELVHQNLLPGGILAFNTFFPNVENWTRGGQAVSGLHFADTDPHGAGRLFAFDTVEPDLVRQRMTVYRQILVTDESGEVVRQGMTVLELRYFYPDELHHLLELTGFEATFYGGFDRQPLQRPDQEMVIVAKRI